MTTDIKILLPELNPAQLKLLKEWIRSEVIGEDDQYTMWSEKYNKFLIHREELVDDRNELRDEQHKRLEKLFK